jgi:glycerol-3-phosphate dehydrogenase
VIEVSSSGLISVMGGKWTIYRRMAEDAVDLAFKQLQAKGENIALKTSISKYLRLMSDFDRNLTKPIQSKREYVNKYALKLRELY